MQSLSIVFDRPLEQKLAEFLPRPDSIGLLIGHRTSSTIFVAHLAKHLHIDGPIGDPEQQRQSEDHALTKGTQKKSSSSAKSEPTFDEQSVLQHVRQVIRMLPGGLDIVGLFVQKKQAENLAAINKCLRSAYKICSRVNSMCGAVVNENPTASDGRMILLTLDSSAGNKKPISTVIVDCRPDAQATAPSTAVPFSYQNLRWRQLSTRLVFDVPLFVSKLHARDSFLKQFTDSIRPWCRRLLTATATVNGQLRDNDELLSNVSTGASTKSGKGKKTMDESEVDAVDLYFMDDQRLDTNANAENGSVFMHIRGTMYCIAFVHQKATVSEGVQALKLDALRSLYGRCELHYDGMAVLEGEELDPVAVHQFPRRVMAPLSKDCNLLVTDYLFEGDVSGDAAGSFKDLLGIDVSTSVIEDKFEILPSEKSLENMLRSSSLSTTPEGSVGDLDRLHSQDLDEAKKKGGFDKQIVIYVMIAIIVAILAILGYAIFGKSE